jgi:DNA-binding NarL/FixJ family response regulator
MSIQLALVDDHQVFREGLRAIVSTQPDVRVVGEASSAREAYAMLDDVKPDVIVMDVSLPGVCGVTATREVLRREPAARVLVLSMHSEPERAADALAAGAMGYALKDQAASALIEAIRAVGTGQRYLAPELPRGAIEDRVRLQGTGSGEDPLFPLSPREKEVFRLAVRGFSNVGIAEELCISIKTVETHRTRINRKLSAHGTADLIRYAAQHGLAID